MNALLIFCLTLINSNNMKKKILTLILAAGLIAVSCDITEEPYGFYSDDNFYKTQGDAEAALLYAYNSFTFIEYTRGITNIGDLPTETTNLKPDEGADAQQLNSWKATSTNETLTNYFKYCYIAINRSNAVIKNVSGSSFPADFKNRIIGEALVLRAWSYFNLVRVFGLVPIQTEMVETVSQTTPTMAKSLDEVYNIILSDCIRAQNLLSVNKVVGRIDKVAAWSILGKAYLQIASSKEHQVVKYVDMQRDANQMYDSAAYWSRKVLYEQTTYGIDPSLKNIYDVEKPDGVEHIFILSQDRTGAQEGNYSKTPLMFLPWVDGAPYYLKYADGSLVYTTNGWEVYRVSPAFGNSFISTDKRKIDLLQGAVYDANGNEVGSVGSGKISSLFCVKYIDPKFVGQKTSAKPYLIRFSDIALTFAEAIGPTTEGYEWINKIRARANIGDLQTGLSLADFRKAVLQERGWEFCYEGHHLYDLRRTASVVSTVTEAKDAGLTEADASFYSLPQQEIDLNPNVNQ